MATLDRKTSYEETRSFDALHNQLVAYMAGAEFGSPRVKALNDLGETWYVAEEIAANIRELGNADPADSKIKLESDLRIAEFKAALLNHQIRTREADVSGYALAFYELFLLTDRLRLACETEMRLEKPALSSEDIQGHTNDLMHDEVSFLLKKTTGVDQSRT